MEKKSPAYHFAMKIVSEYLLPPATRLHKVRYVIDLLKRFEKVRTDSADDFFAMFVGTLFGLTPRNETMQSIKSLFTTVQSDNKNLFILSDGESTDGDRQPIATEMEKSYKYRDWLSNYKGC